MGKGPIQVEKALAVEFTMVSLALLAFLLFHIITFGRLLLIISQSLFKNFFFFAVDLMVGRLGKGPILRLLLLACSAGKIQ